MSDPAQSPASSPIKKILVPTDFSENASKAYRYANDFARHHQASVDLIHVITVHTEGAIYGSVYFPVYEKEFIEASNKRLAELAAEQFDSAISVATHTLDGAPVTEIVDFAKKNETDLLVVSTHGHTGLKHLMLGSTAENLVRRAPCPVLVVKDPEHDFSIE